MEDDDDGDIFFDALDQLADPEERAQDLVDSSSSVTVLPPEVPNEPPSSPPPRRNRQGLTPARTTSRRRRSSSIRSSSSAGPSTSQAGDPPCGPPIGSPKGRWNRAILGRGEWDIRAEDDSLVSEVTSNRIFPSADQEVEIPIAPPGDDQDVPVVEQNEARYGGGIQREHPNGILFDLAGLVVKAVAFQIALLISSLIFPFRLLRWSVSLVSDPFGTLKHTGDFAADRLVTAVCLLRDLLTPFVFRWLRRQQGLARLALRITLGIFWSLYILSVLVGCVVVAVLVGRLLMQKFLEEPVRISEELLFDYTKGSPVAIFPLTSCHGRHCKPSCNDVLETEGVEGEKKSLVPSSHKLQVIVSLTLPESEYNRRLGIFQVKVEFLSTNGDVTTSTSRPSMLKYKSYPIQFVETMFKGVLVLLGYSMESQTLRIKMKGFDEKTDSTACVRVTIEPRAEYRPGAGIPEIYSATLTLESELPLFKRIFWYWRRTIFIWICTGLFVNELFIILLCCKPVLIPSTILRIVP